MKFTKLSKKLRRHKKPLLAVLIDPDKFNPELIALANKSEVSCFLVGGSELKKGSVDKTVLAIKKSSKIPIVLFPGDETQLTGKADGLLLLSLLSGRNPEYLIEKHISAAPLIKRMGIPYLSTAYLLIEGGKTSTTQRVTKTAPLSLKNADYIVNTAIAAEQLGFKAVYLEAGSGAKTAVPEALIKRIKSQIEIPVIVGGGINSALKTKALLRSGADMLVVGNALEKNVYLLTELSECFRQF